MSGWGSFSGTASASTLSTTIFGSSNGQNVMVFTLPSFFGFNRMGKITYVIEQKQERGWSDTKNASGDSGNSGGSGLSSLLSLWDHNDNTATASRGTIRSGWNEGGSAWSGEGMGKTFASSGTSGSSMCGFLGSGGSSNGKWWDSGSAGWTVQSTYSTESTLSSSGKSNMWEVATQSHTAFRSENGKKTVLFSPVGFPSTSGGSSALGSGTGSSMGGSMSSPSPVVTDINMSDGEAVPPSMNSSMSSAHPWASLAGTSSMHGWGSSAFATSTIASPIVGSNPNLREALTSRPAPNPRESTQAKTRHALIHPHPTETVDRLARDMHKSVHDGSLGAITFESVDAGGGAAWGGPTSGRIAAFGGWNGSEGTVSRITSTHEQSSSLIATVDSDPYGLALFLPYPADAPSGIKIETKKPEITAPSIAAGQLDLSSSSSVAPLDSEDSFRSFRAGSKNKKTSGFPYYATPVCPISMTTGRRKVHVSSGVMTAAVVGDAIRRQSASMSSPSFSSASGPFFRLSSCPIPAVALRAGH